MKIRFYDEQQRPLLDVVADTEDYWSACERGHEILISGILCGAEDFQVLEIFDRSAFVLVDKIVNSSILGRLRTAA